MLDRARTTNRQPWRVGSRPRWLALATLALIATSLTSCGRRDPGPEVDGWQVVLQTLPSQARSCPFARLELCIHDPAFMKPVVQKVLDRRYKGEMPTHERDVKRVIRRARVSYGAAQLGTEEGRAAVTKLLRQAYDQAKPTVTPGRVHIDLGLLPAPIVPGARSGYCLAPERATEAVGVRWDAKEIARVLEPLARSHPKVPVISATVIIKSCTRRKVMTVSWMQRSRRLVFSQLNRGFRDYTEPLDSPWQGLRAGTIDLSSGALKTCTIKTARTDNVPCPPP